MVTVKREATSGQIVFSTSGEFGDKLLTALLDAIALAPDEADLVIDLGNTGVLSQGLLERLAVALTARLGTVSFRHAGPWHAPVLNAILVPG